MSQTVSTTHIAGACCNATAHNVFLSCAWSSGARDLSIVVIRGDRKRESQKGLVQLFVDNFLTARTGRRQCGVDISILPRGCQDQPTLRHPRRRRYFSNNVTGAHDDSTCRASWSRSWVSTYVPCGSTSGFGCSRRRPMVRSVTSVTPGTLVFRTGGPGVPQTTFQ
jgi:hypothetical protein